MHKKEQVDGRPDQAFAETARGRPASCASLGRQSLSTEGCPSALFEHKLRRRWSRHQQVSPMPPAEFTTARAKLSHLIIEADWEKKIRPPMFLKNQEQLFEGSLNKELTGVGSENAINQLVGGMHNIFGNWPHYRNARKRQEVIGDLLISISKQIGISVVRFIGSDKADAVCARFVNSSDRYWHIVYNNLTLKMPFMDWGTRVEICDTLAHELRHAEQQFRAAQAWAMAEIRNGRKENVEDRLSKQKAIPLSVAKEAVTPLMQSGGGLIGYAEQFSKIVDAELTDEQKKEKNPDDGTGEKGLTRLRDLARSYQERLTFSVDGYRYFQDNMKDISELTTKLEAQIALVKRRYDAYLTVPEEVDAARIGSVAAHAYQARYLPFPRDKDQENPVSDS